MLQRPLPASSLSCERSSLHQNCYARCHYGRVHSHSMGVHHHHYHYRCVFFPVQLRESCLAQQQQPPGLLLLLLQLLHWHWAEKGDDCDAAAHQEEKKKRWWPLLLLLFRAGTVKGTSSYCFQRQRLRMVFAQFRLLSAAAVVARYDAVRRHRSAVGLALGSVMGQTSRASRV